MNSAEKFSTRVNRESKILDRKDAVAMTVYKKTWMSGRLMPPGMSVWIHCIIVIQPADWDEALLIIRDLV